MNNPYSILVVDDEEMVLQALVATLGDVDARIIPTTSAAEAIHLLSSYRFAVLLCDLNLDDHSGTEVLATAREYNPQIVSMLITGGSDMDATIQAINEGGIWKCITKPWKPEALVETMNAALARFRKFDQAEHALSELAKSRAAIPKAIPKTPVEGMSTDTMIAERYMLQEQIGEGGSGVIFKAEDSLLNLPVAIKMLSDDFTARTGALITLKEEARIAMQLSHRHIVRLHNLQRHGASYFIVMEYVPGCTLLDVLSEDGCFPPQTVIPVIRVCADALAYAHRHGVIHKDLKLDNLLLSEDGVLKIIDFGIACLTDHQSSDGMIVGTPAYMSPEQKMGELVDEGSDIYSFAMMIYHLLRGRLPFPDDATEDEILGMAPMELIGLDPAILQVLERAISANRSDRHANVTEFAAELVDAISD